jgi:hypothetical protein
VKRGSVVIAFTVMWGAYAMLFTGYCWMKGYDISARQIVGPVNFYTGQWPPSPAAATEIIPSGKGS